MPYQITEPHPTARPNTYMHTGRGGAGNMYKVKPSTSTSSPLSKIATAGSSSSSKSSRVSTGRGGAANIRESSDISHFSLDEEMALQTRDANHDVWHVGRGGAGNWTGKAPAKAERKYSNESGSSEGSSRSGFLGRLSGAFDRN